MVYVFFRLMYLTRKLHNYEYNENKRSMILFFATMSCFIAFSFFELLYIASLDTVSLAGDYNSSGETQLIDICKNVSVLYKYVVTLRDIFSMYDIGIAYCVMYIKKPKDVFQGISKLDYLLKVSIF